MINNKVTGLYQDAKGFLWIATQVGLQRYDGARFKNYVADIRDTAALQSDWISSIFEDSKMRLWIGADHGAPYLLDRATDKFYNYNLHASVSNKVNGVWHFAEDSRGNIWVAGHDGYYKLDAASNQFIRMNNELGLAAGIKPGYMTIDEDDNLWLCTPDGLKFYNSKEKKLYGKEYNPEHNPLLDIKEGVANITRGGNNLWVSTSIYGNLYRYDLTTRQLKTYSFDSRLIFQKSSGPSFQKEPVGQVFSLAGGQIIVPLAGRGIAFYHADKDSFEIVNANNDLDYAYHTKWPVIGDVYMIQDRDKNIVIGNETGISICNPDRQSFFTHGINNEPADHFPETSVSDFLELPDGHILVGYYSAEGGIVKIDSGFHFVHRYMLNENSNKSSASNEVWNLFRDDKGIIWGPNQQFALLKLDPATDKITEEKDTSFGGAITIIRQDTDGDIWFGLWKKGLGEADAVTHTKHFYTGFLQADPAAVKRVISILPDSDKIWVGTSQFGLQVFDKRTKKFTEAFLPNEFDKNAISSNSITDIVRYNKDTLVISTEMGVNIFDIRQKKFTTITMKEGLPNNLALSVMADPGSGIWVIFSSGGFCKINIKTLAVTRYDINDGLIDNEFSCRFYRLKNGKVLMGSSRSFVSFDPAAIKEQLPPAPVTITGLHVSGKEVMTDSLLKDHQPLNLSYKENSLRIEFSSLQLVPPGHIKYYYKLDGVDEDWVAADKNQTAVYNQLSNGNYVFNIKCTNRDGVVCREITQLKIIIHPPFWKTWWFITLVILFILFLAYLFVRWREQNIRTVQQSKIEMMVVNEKLSEAKLEALRSQMNPHFIFNSLNAIQECILTGKVDAAYTYLSQFSKLQRMVLNNSAKEFISLSSELEMLKLYLSLESLRFSQSFTWTVGSDKNMDTDDIMVPSMLIQPFAENAIWHGLRNKEGEKLLRISCEEEKGSLVIVVDDNGIGRQKAASIKEQKLGGHTESKGIALSQQRIDILSLKYKTAIKVEFTDKRNDKNEAAGTSVTITLPFDTGTIKQLS